MDIQITRANTKYDNAVKEINRLKSLNAELVREIDRLSNKADRLEILAYHAISDFVHVGCKSNDTVDSIREDLANKFFIYKKQIDVIVEVKS